MAPRAVHNTSIHICPRATAAQASRCPSASSRIASLLGFLLPFAVLQQRYLGEKDYKLA